MKDRSRFVRQMLVAGVGEAGQDRIGAAIAEVGGEGLHHEVATAYARRAGVAEVVAGAIDETALAPPFLTHPAARAVVAGSRAALGVLRAALLSPSPPREPT